MIKTKSKVAVPYTKQTRQNKANGRCRPSTPTASFLAVPSEAATPSFATWPTLASKSSNSRNECRMCVASVRTKSRLEHPTKHAKQKPARWSFQVDFHEIWSWPLPQTTTQNHLAKCYMFKDISSARCSMFLPMKKHPRFVFSRPYPTSSFSMAGSMCTNNEISKVSHAWGVLIITQRHYSAAKQMERTEKKRATHAGHAKSTLTNGFEPKPAQWHGTKNACHESLNNTHGTSFKHLLCVPPTDQQTWCENWDWNNWFLCSSSLSFLFAIFFRLHAMSRWHGPWWVAWLHHWPS